MVKEVQWSLIPGALALWVEDWNCLGGNVLPNLYERITTVPARPFQLVVWPFVPSSVHHQAGGADITFPFQGCPCDHSFALPWTTRLPLSIPATTTLLRRDFSVNRALTTSIAFRPAKSRDRLTPNSLDPRLVGS